MVDEQQTHGQRIADLIERYCELREACVKHGYGGTGERISIAKRELAEAIDELVATCKISL